MTLLFLQLILKQYNISLIKSTNTLVKGD